MLCTLRRLVLLFAVLYWYWLWS